MHYVVYMTIALHIGQLQSNVIITHYFRPHYSYKSVRYKENFTENLVTVKSKKSRPTRQIVFRNYH